MIENSFHALLGLDILKDTRTNISVMSIFFSGVFKRLDRNCLKRWVDVSGLIFLSSPYLPSYSEESKFMEIDKSNSAYAAQHEHLALIQRLSRSENVLYGTNLENLSAEMMSKSCDNLSVETNNRTRDKSNLRR